MFCQGKLPAHAAPVLVPKFYLLQYGQQRSLVSYTCARGYHACRLKGNQKDDLVQDLQSVAVNGPDLMNIDEAMAVGADFKQYDSLRSALLRIARGPDDVAKVNSFLTTGMSEKEKKVTLTREAADVRDFLAKYCEIYVDGASRKKVAANWEMDS